jgi:hypothetical protein
MLLRLLHTNLLLLLLRNILHRLLPLLRLLPSLHCTGSPKHSRSNRLLLSIYFLRLHNSHRTPLMPYRHNLEKILNTPIHCNKMLLTLRFHTHLLLRRLPLSPSPFHFSGSLIDHHLLLHNNLLHLHQILQQQLFLRHHQNQLHQQ